MDRRHSRFHDLIPIASPSDASSDRTTTRDIGSPPSKNQEVIYGSDPTDP